MLKRTANSVLFCTTNHSSKRQFTYCKIYCRLNFFVTKEKSLHQNALLKLSHDYNSDIRSCKDKRKWESFYQIEYMLSGNHKQDEDKSERMSNQQIAFHIIIIFLLSVSFWWELTFMVLIFPCYFEIIHRCPFC